jgi:hypothetical protein
MKKKQQYIVFLNGDSRMGASSTVRFCEEDKLQNFNLYAEYIDVYPIGKMLTKAQKKKLGMTFSR